MNCTTELRQICVSGTDEAAALSAAEWAETRLGSQVLEQNPEYLMNLAEAQESVANQVNSILGDNFVSQRFFGQLPKIASIFGRL